jgi:hypothetical protein
MLMENKYDSRRLGHQQFALAAQARSTVLVEWELTLTINRRNKECFHFYATNRFCATSEEGPRVGYVHYGVHPSDNVPLCAIET